MKQHQLYIYTQQVLSSNGLDNVDIILRDGFFSSDIGIVNLHPFRGTHGLLDIHEDYFDSYGCAPPQKLSKIKIIRNGYCSFSEYKIQGLTNKRDGYCASYYLYINYLIKVLGIDFKSAVLNLYYQMFSWY